MVPHQWAYLHLEEDQVAALDLVAAQVQEVPAITDPYHPVEYQDFHQVASLELDPPPSVSPRLKVTASDTVVSPDMSPSATFMEVETWVPVLALADLNLAASSVYTERQAVVSDQAVLVEGPAQAREVDLDWLALAREQAPEAVTLLLEVDQHLPCTASEAFTPDPLPLSGASNKAQAPLVMAATTVVTAYFPATATVTILLVWAAATD